MFTGLVEEAGTVRHVTGLRGNRVLRIEARFAAELNSGDSVAVDGCCLTVTDADHATFAVEATGATLRQTTLSRLVSGSKVNLEQAVAAGDRLGGHIVQGHVDEVAAVTRVERKPGYWRLGFRVKEENSRLLVGRGSVCVNGVSLTIAAVGRSGFEVNVIPHTWHSTTLQNLRPGTTANVEYDFLAKMLLKAVDVQNRNV